MVVFHTDSLGLSVSALVYLLLFYADYALVYQVIEYGRNPSTIGSFQALFAHFLVVMAVICHIRAMLSDPGYVPLPTTKIDFSSDLERMAETQNKKKKKEPPAMDEWTICTKCETYRPPRSHHCRKCNRCVRRMDHHCPWMNNCIGVLNFKYFYLFLVYIGAFCLYSLILVSRDWWVHYNNDNESVPDKVMTVILFFEAIIFGMFVTAVGTGQTIAILCDRNALEIRRYGAPRKMPKTPRSLLVQAVCGRGPKLFWLLPCIQPRIPDPVPPSKYVRTFNLPNSIENV